jgi:hypothetical protein
LQRPQRVNGSKQVKDRVVRWTELTAGVSMLEYRANGVGRILWSHRESP